MRGRWLLAGVALALLLPAEAAAWKRSLVRGTQVCLFWESRELPWTLNERGSADLTMAGVQAALRRSYESWSSVECTDMRFAEMTTSSATAVGYDGDRGTKNLLVFRERLCEDVVEADDPCWNDFSCGNEEDCWSFARGVIAVTTTSYREDTGEIVDADIEFNGATFRFTTEDGPPCTSEGQARCVATDLANTATHEIGHVLGIDHSDVAGATMFASAPLGETDKRLLADDDIDAMCAIYPAGDEVLVCEDAYGLRREGRDGGCGCESGAGATGLAWLAAGAGLLGWRRRQR